MPHRGAPAIKEGGWLTSKDVRCYCPVPVWHRIPRPVTYLWLRPTGSTFVFLAAGAMSGLHLLAPLFGLILVALT